MADASRAPDMLRLRVQRSKTDQEGRGRFKIIPAIADARLDPVGALVAWMDAADIEGGPLFRPVDRWGRARARSLSRRAVARITKTAVHRAGLDARRFSGHSLHRGFVTEATRRGANLLDVMEMTWHRSPVTLKGYVEEAGIGATRAGRIALGDVADGRML